MGHGLVGRWRRGGRVWREGGADADKARVGRPAAGVQPTEVAGAGPGVTGVLCHAAPAQRRCTAGRLHQPQPAAVRSWRAVIGAERAGCFSRRTCTDTRTATVAAAMHRRRRCRCTARLPDPLPLPSPHSRGRYRRPIVGTRPAPRAARLRLKRRTIW